MKVRVNRVYVFNACSLDIMLSQHHRATAGQLVRVVSQPGAPKANTMNHCHIEDAKSGEFLGMVSCNSLTKAQP